MAKAPHEIKSFRINFEKILWNLTTDRGQFIWYVKSSYKSITKILTFQKENNV